MDVPKLSRSKGLKLLRLAMGKENGYVERSVRSLFEYMFQEDVIQWEYHLINQQYFLMHPSTEKNYRFTIDPNLLPPIRRETAGAIACLATYRALDEHPVFQKQFDGIYQHYQETKEQELILKAVESFDNFPKNVNRNEEKQSVRLG